MYFNAVKNHMTSETHPPCNIIVFQQRSSAVAKICGISEYGHNVVITKVFDIDADLPDFIDNPEEYISDDFSCDLVLCFLNHPDLADYLVAICSSKNIPVIASGKKTKGAYTPFTCCGLGRHHSLGAYGEQFGLPELTVEILADRVNKVKVLRGASCGATWEAAHALIGLPVEQAISTYAREVQYLCQADPSAFDPVSGKSALHHAGDVHAAALKKALAALIKK